MLSGLCWKSLLVYLDDVIVFGTSFEVAINTIKAVFDRFGGWFEVESEQVSTVSKGVAYFGYVVSSGGVATDPDGIKAVSDWPRPIRLTDD